MVKIFQNDFELVENVLDGDMKSFDAIIYKYEFSIFKYILNMVKDEYAAKDLAQEVFITVYNKLYTYRGDDKFCNWLYKIARNKCLDYLRKNRKVIELSLENAWDMRSKELLPEQFKIYESLRSISANPPADFSSSRSEILARIDKTRYSNKLLNKAGFFFRRNSLRYAVSGIALILLICLSPYIYNNFRGNNKVITSNSKDARQNKLDIISDVEYISLLQEGEAKGAYLDKVIFADKDNALTEKIKDSILSGKIIEDTSTSPSTVNPLIIGIKQKDGTYLEGEYKNGKVTFTKPAKITVKTDVRMEQIIQDFKARKLNTSPQDIKFSGQVRNNKIVIERTKTYSFGEDSVFKSFKGSDKKPTEYEQALIKEAVSVGIDEKKLSNALAQAKNKSKNIIQYPVIIDTGVYRDKACFILTFTWEGVGIIKDKNKVQNLGHVFTVILDEDGNEVSYATCS